MELHHVDGLGPGERPSVVARERRLSPSLSWSPVVDTPENAA